MNNKTYTLHSDAYHGWLEVPVEEIEKLGIKNNISNFSYINNNLAYLEEDCDAVLFIKAYEKYFGSKPKISFKENNKIRYFSRFNFN
jgi:hypothetical protein